MGIVKEPYNDTCANEFYLHVADARGIESFWSTVIRAENRHGLERQGARDMELFWPYSFQPFNADEMFR